MEKKAKNTSSPQKTKRKKTAAIIICVICALALITGGILLFTNRENIAINRQMAQMEKINDNFSQIENSFWSENKPTENAINTLLKKEYDYATSLKEKGTLKDVSLEAETLCLVCTMPQGDVIVYTPEIEGLKAGGSNSRIVTLQPYYNTKIKSEAPDKAAKEVASKVKGYKFDSADNFDNEKVNMQALKKLSGAKIIIWDGHGTYTASTGSVVSIDIPYKTVKKDKEFRKYCDGKHILANGKSHTLLTASFFKDYYQKESFDGAVIYLGTCLSAFDSSMADAFIANGAEAVYANYYVTTVGYDSKMTTSIFGALADGETAETALKIAQDKNGECDIETTYDYDTLCRRNKVILSGNKDFSLTGSKPKEQPTETTTQEETTTETTKQKSSIVQKLATEEWSLYIPAEPGLVENFKFNDNNKVLITNKSEGGTQQETATYSVENDKTIKFSDESGAAITVSNAFSDSDMLLIQFDYSDSGYAVYGVLNKNVPKNSTEISQSFLQDLEGTTWNSEYFSKSIPAYELVSFYNYKDSALYGGIMVDHGEYEFSGQLITENCASFICDSAQTSFVVEKSKKSDKLNVIIISTGENQKAVAETWNRTT